MKKKLLTILLVLFSISVCLFTLMACKHKHTFTNYVSDNNATVDADGTKTAICDRDDCNQKDTITDAGSKLVPSQGLEYTLNQNKQSYSVTGLGNCTDTDVILASTYENKPVIGIGNSAFYGCSSLTSVEIPNSITSIGDWAFFGCSSLTSIEIPNNVISIGKGAFLDCFRLVEVINKSNHIITVTKGSADNGHLGYFALAVYNSGAIFTGTKLSFDNGYIVYTVGTEKILVGYNGTQTNLTIPNYITKINKFAFPHCDNLASIIIPDSVTSIDERAFLYCSSLTSVKIGYGVECIGDSAFAYCDNLTSIKYSGTESEWLAISKGSRWDDSTGNYTITYNYTGE